MSLFIQLGVIASRGASGPLSLTNNQKLSLPPATPVGTQVNVTDAFQPTGSGSPQIETIYFQNGTLGGKAYYPNGLNVTAWNADLGQWEISRSGLLYYISTNDTEFPWQATYVVGDFGSEPPPTLTNPLPQQLNAPSSTVTAMFVGGAGTSEANAIYTYRGTNDDREFYNTLGTPGFAISPTSSAISWSTADAQWRIFNVGGAILYFSLDDVSTPDLVTTWVINPGIGDLPAPTVSPITQGELDAGLYVTLAGTATSNGVFPSTGTPQNGRQSYPQIANPSTNMSWDVGLTWVLYDDDLGDVAYGNSANTPFPAGTYIELNGASPAPTVVQDNVCSEANWGPV